MNTKMILFLLSAFFCATSLDVCNLSYSSIGQQDNNLVLAVVKKTNQDNKGEKGQSFCKIPKELKKLADSYPEFLDIVDSNTLRWKKDGQKMKFDDGKKKDFKALLNFPDLQDQFARYYWAGRKYPINKRNFDPGRIRYEPFFKKMYGSTSDEVKKSLVTITWLPNTAKVPIRVTSINGVGKRLHAISRELEELLKNRPSLKKYIDQPAGGFKWRPIAGTKRLSAHSFGIAFDINVKPYADYWRWKKGKLSYTNRIPLVIVEIFEKYGFIWGGKWYHYDTMHFEYRPELLDNVVSAKDIAMLKPKSKNITQVFTGKHLENLLLNVIAPDKAIRVPSFDTLKNVLQHLPNVEQEGIIKFYLIRIPLFIEDGHEVGVYNATRVISMLSPSLLKRYKGEIKENYEPIYNKNKWGSHKWNETLNFYKLIKEKLSSPDVAVPKPKLQNKIPAFDGDLEKLLSKVIARKKSNRIRGYKTLIDNLPDVKQEKVIKFYLSHIPSLIKTGHEVGVYNATRVISKLSPSLLKKYRMEIEKGYEFILKRPRQWENTLKYYNKIKEKISCCK